MHGCHDSHVQLSCEVVRIGDHGRENQKSAARDKEQDAASWTDACGARVALLTAVVKELSQIMAVS